jgi:ELWxxDGT repeat protein
MKTSFWRQWWKSIHRAKPVRPISRAGTGRRTLLRLEQLEDRTLLSGTPQMVRDINPTLLPSIPSQMVAIGSTIYFAADDGVNGRELWKSDGSTAGTTLVKDIYPGDTNIYGYLVPNSSYLSHLTNVNGTLFFSANDGTHGYELWKSDGTADGTTLVKDINPGGDGSLDWSFNALTNVNGTLFFVADDGVNGRELWRSDGTADGTVLVKDILPGRDGSLDLRSNVLMDVNGTLFFRANDGTHGYELWKSDGTADGTTLVKDINSGGNAYPVELTNFKGTLFFSANDGTHGEELWRSDGTTAGTVLVKDINSGGASSYSRSLTNVNGLLFFSAGEDTAGGELWRSDGTTAGTTLVKDIAPGSVSSLPNSLTNLNGTLFFAADDGMHGYELWKSDGTASGTTLVKDLDPGTGLFGHPDSSYPNFLTDVNGTLFFEAYDGPTGWELWQSDGSASGTILVKDINAGSSSSSPVYLLNVNGTLFFSADDGVHGAELWMLSVADSTPAPSLGMSGFPTTTTAGVAATFTVTAKKANGTTNTSYTGAVHFTSSDGQAVLPNDYTFTPADQGVHTFSATLKTAGTQSLTVTDTSGLSGGETGITVNPAVASHLVVTGLPSFLTAGTPATFTVTAKDAYGNTATGYSGTIHFTSSDSQAVLPANATLSQGIGQFSATLKTAGPQSITATDTLNPTLSDTEGGITVTPAAASRYVLTAPSKVSVGVPFSLSVTVVDAFGNVIVGYTGTIHFGSTDTRAKLPAKYTFTAADRGVHTFTGLVLRKRGNQKITITDTRNPSLTGSVTENVL